MPRTKFSNDDINVMGDSFVFKRLPEPEMMVILKECLVKRFSPGEIILKEGDMGRGVYIILEGDVEVYLPKLSVTGENRPTEVNLAKLTPGVCFGEYSLLDEKEASASVKALTEVRLCFFSGFDFQRICDENHLAGKIMYRNLLDLMVRRLRRMDKELDIAFLAE